MTIEEYKAVVIKVQAVTEDSILLEGGDALAQTEVERITRTANIETVLGEIREECKLWRR